MREEDLLSLQKVFFARCLVLRAGFVLHSPKVEEPEIKRRKLIYFDQFADGTLKFDNGETVKISNTSLAVQSKIFHEMFLTGTDNVIEIRDCSVQDFKIFLNCILGLEKCTFDRAFKVWPIACKYEVDEFIKECVEILTPKKKKKKMPRGE